MCFGNIDLVTYVDLEEKIPQRNLKFKPRLYHFSSCFQFFCSPIPHLKQARTKHIRHEESYPDDLT